jgi:tetratricopeptide (TPR) repeat protein
VNARIYFNGSDTIPAARRDAAKRALENAQKLEPNSSETLLALGYYQYLVLRDFGLAKTTFERVSKVLPSSSEVPYALAVVARREGHWDQSVAYWEQALALDPRNVELLILAAETYSMLRQFPTALKLYDRALDITPNDADVMAIKASIYQAQGNLEEAARFLSEINERTNDASFLAKIIQLRLERNYGEAIRLLQAREAQFHFDSEFRKCAEQLLLALMQRLSGDTAGAKVTAEKAYNTLEHLYRDQPDNVYLVRLLAQARAAMGEKDSALREAERAVMFAPPAAKDALEGPATAENLALIQTMFGENSGAITTLTELLKTPYSGSLYGAPITPALLRLDPLWDPLRTDPAFQKLCEEKQP